MMLVEYFDYPLYFFYGLIFFGLVKKFLKRQSTTTEYRWFVIAWFSKMIGCLVYAWIILYYYGYGDTLGYYTLSTILRNAILDDPANISYFFGNANAFREVAPYFGKEASMPLWAFDYYNDSNFIIHKAGCLISFFTFNRFLLISLVFANISFWSAILIYKGLKKIFPEYLYQIAIATLFIPSAIFWNCGFTKEPVCMICIAIIFFTAVNFISGKKPSMLMIVLVIAASFILYTVKNYIFICLIAATILWFFYFFIEKIFRSKPFLKAGFFLLLFFAIAIGGFLLWNSLEAIMRDNIGETITTNASVYQEIHKHQGGGSLIELEDFDRTSPMSVLAFLPQAILNVLFRPWPWEINNPLMVLTVLENLFFIFFFGRLLIYTRGFTRKVSMNSKFHFFVLAFTLLLALVIGISTFNFGTLVRYRIPFLPFWVFFLLMKSKEEKALVTKPYTAIRKLA